MSFSISDLKIYTAIHIKLLGGRVELPEFFKSFMNMPRTLSGLAHLGTIILAPNLSN